MAKLNCIFSGHPGLSLWAVQRRQGVFSTDRATLKALDFALPRYIWPFDVGCIPLNNAVRFNGWMEEIRDGYGALPFKLNEATTRMQ